MQTSFPFWSVWFFKLSDPRSEGTYISIDLALLIHLRLNLSIPFYDGGVPMTIKPSSHNTRNIYTALRQFLNELSPETLRDRSGLLTPFCTQTGNNLPKCHLVSYWIHNLIALFRNNGSFNTGHVALKTSF